jgi:outer membrane protein OmpA-like peptidoglycan-associated protein
MKRMFGYRMIVVHCVVACLLLWLASTTGAQSKSNVFQETKEDFLKALSPAPKSGLQAKGLPGKGPAGIVPDNYAELIESSGSVARSLILFDFDSSSVKEDSYPILRNLADVLTNELKDAKLVVAGHTDSVGTDEYNWGLSERRAQAVKTFLASAYDIDPDRLILKWYGESQPFITANPEDARNRRVEFIRIQ